MSQRVVDGYMTPSQASRYLNVHYELVRSWMREGRLEVRRDGKFHLVSIRSVVAIAGEVGIEVSGEVGPPAARPSGRERPRPPSGRFRPTRWPGRSLSRCGRCGGNVIGGSCLQCGREIEGT